jgi:hypothetical protein
VFLKNLKVNRDPSGSDIDRCIGHGESVIRLILIVVNDIRLSG